MLTKAWLDSETDADDSGISPSTYYGPMREPLIIKPEDGGFEGLGGKLPSQKLTVADVARLVGPDRQVDVIGQYTLLPLHIPT
jgi:F-box/leucine-rich repeat protein 10/11